MQKWIFCLLFLFSTPVFAELRDPTRPLGFKGASKSEVGGLQAIIISGESRSAVFNGRIIHRGDQVAGFEVVSIEPNTVHLEGIDGKMVLFLFNQNIRQDLGR